MSNLHERLIVSNSNMSEWNLNYFQTALGVIYTHYIAWYFPTHVYLTS